MGNTVKTFLIGKRGNKSTKENLERGNRNASNVNISPNSIKKELVELVNIQSGLLQNLNGPLKIQG
jgi:hypothetical protein